MRRRAFTLIEVLLAMALLMMLLTAFYVFLDGAGVAQQTVREAAGRQLHARTLCDMVERDLMCCLVGDSSSGAGVAGGATNLSVLTRHVSSWLATEGYENRLALNDLESAEFVFDENAGMVTIRREPVKSVRPASGAETDSEATSASSNELAESEAIGPMVRVRFRYFDGSAWRQSFDSLAEERLPIAVEISIWLYPFAEEPGDRELEPDEATRDALTAEDDANVQPSVDPDSEAGARADDARDAGGAEEVEEAEEAEEIPPPDVVRVVMIPDAAPPPSDSSEGGS